jgi:murein DD-endopeptidase MepM/ murein hydrolase activator NlpD
MSLDNEKLGASLARRALTEHALKWPIDDSALQRVGDTVTPDRGNGKPHYGLDLYAPAGSIVRAAAPGRVLRVQDGRQAGRINSRRAGLFVDVLSKSGWVHRYLHLQESPLVVGQTLTAGALVGSLASTGAPDVIRTGPHLHFEIRTSDVSGSDRKYGPAVDPLRFLPSRMRNT